MSIVTVFTKERLNKALDKVLEQSFHTIILLVALFFLGKFLVAEMDKNDSCQQQFIEFIQEQRKEEKLERREREKREADYMKIIERSNILNEQVLKKVH